MGSLTYTVPALVVVFLCSVTFAEPLIVRSLLSTFTVMSFGAADPGGRTACTTNVWLLNTESGGPPLSGLMLICGPARVVVLAVLDGLAVVFAVAGGGVVS